MRGRAPTRGGAGRVRAGPATISADDADASLRLADEAWAALSSLEAHVCSPLVAATRSAGFVVLARCCSNGGQRKHKQANAMLASSPAFGRSGARAFERSGFGLRAPSEPTSAGARRARPTADAKLAIGRLIRAAEIIALGDNSAACGAYVACLLGFVWLLVFQLRLRLQFAVRRSPFALLFPFPFPFPSRFSLCLSVCLFVSLSLLCSALFLFRCGFHRSHSTAFAYPVGFCLRLVLQFHQLDQLGASVWLAIARLRPIHCVHLARSRVLLGPKPRRCSARSQARRVARRALEPVAPSGRAAARSLALGRIAANATRRVDRLCGPLVYSGRAPSLATGPKARAARL